MPLTRGDAVGYDAELMVFKFTMRNGEQIVPCEISNAALGNLAGRWRCGERNAAAEFKVNRKSHSVRTVRPNINKEGNQFGPHFCETHFDSAART